MRPRSFININFTYDSIIDIFPTEVIILKYNVDKELFHFMGK